MGREMLVRLWNPFSNSYLYDVENVYQCLAQQNIFDGIQKSRLAQTLPFDHAKDGFIWEQFIGTVDINNVREFEGDIVRIAWVTPSKGRYFQSDDAWCENEAICTIKYVGNRFVYERPTGRQLSIRNDAKREVVGNIHEKPELLKT